MNLKISYIAAVIVCLFFTASCAAQSSYGFRIGVNIADIDGDLLEGFDTGSVTDLVAGSYVTYDLRYNLGVQVEVLYSTKGIALSSPQLPDVESVLQAVYIETPVLLTYTWEATRSLTPSFHVGPALAFEISERLFDRTDGFEQSQSSTLLASPDVGFAVGLDLNLRLLSIDVLAGMRYTRGLRNLSSGDVDSEAKNRALSFSIGFLL